MSRRPRAAAGDVRFEAVLDSRPASDLVVRPARTDGRAPAPESPHPAQAAHGTATVVLRAGLVLLAAVAVVDTVLALSAGARPGTVAFGAAIVVATVAGAWRPRAAGRLLAKPGRAPALVLLFVLLGLVDGDVPTYYAQVGSGMIWVVAVVSSPVWIATGALVGAAGYVVGLAAGGHSWSWILGGGDNGTTAVQTADILANGGAGVIAVLFLRRLVDSAPAVLADVRAGGPALTPALAAAVRGPGMVLPRADPRALTAALSPAEQRVVDLLVAGRAPKQAAGELGISLPTVRSHIASAKRKTGARTLHQLVGIVAEGTAGGR